MYHGHSPLLHVHFKFLSACVMRKKMKNQNIVALPYFYLLVVLRVKRYL